MAVIKEESEDMKIEDTFRVKHEETGWFHSHSSFDPHQNVQVYRNEWYFLKDVLIKVVLFDLDETEQQKDLVCEI